MTTTPIPSDGLDGLSDDELLERAEARDRLEDLDTEHDVRAFMKRHSPDFERPDHLGELCEALDLSMRKPCFILVEAAPRHGKTEVLMHHMARHIKFRPRENVIYCSYASQLALRKSRRTRALAARAGALVTAEGTRGFDQLDPSKAVSYWQTAEGGAFMAGGRGGAYVGDGAKLIVMDDLYKNRVEAESEKISDSVFEDLFQGTLYTRLEPGGSIVSNHQPWNDRDINARLRAWARETGIELIEVRLPAVRKPRYDSRGRLVGGKVLWEKRWPLPELAKIQGTIGDYNFESQYQCNRVPKGARVFKVAECVRYTTPRRDHVVPAASCDPGIEKDVKRDPSAFIVGHGYLDSRGSTCIDLLLAHEVNIEIPETVDELEAINKQHSVARILIEEVSGFKSVSQIARRLDAERRRRVEVEAQLPLQSVVPVGSKWIRALPTATAIKQGRIRVPAGAPWVEALEKQLRNFTGKPGGQDNLVDALTQLYDWFELRLRSLRSRGRHGGETEMGSPSF
jgi:predicted phage terminase large subunit-like protein